MSISHKGFVNAARAQARPYSSLCSAADFMCVKIQLILSEFSCNLFLTPADHNNNTMLEGEWRGGAVS